MKISSILLEENKIELVNLYLYARPLCLKH